VHVHLWRYIQEMKLTPRLDRQIYTFPWSGIVTKFCLTDNFWMRCVLFWECSFLLFGARMNGLILYCRSEKAWCLIPSILLLSVMHSILTLDNYGNLQRYMAREIYVFQVHTCTDEVTECYVQLDNARTLACNFLLFNMHLFCSSIIKFLSKNHGAWRRWTRQDIIWEVSNAF